MSLPKPEQKQREPEAFNTISHLVGAVLALAGVVVLLVFASIDGDARKIVAFAIYGTTLFLLYLVSTLYHGLRGRGKQLFELFDHQAIYLLIAGTYTPFTLLTLRDQAVGWWLFGVTWGIAVIGVVYEALWRRGARIVPVIVYLAMGWSIVAALQPVIDSLPPAGFAWLLAGGLFYTSGVIFYAWSHWIAWMHGVWHIFVLLGSISHYVAILFYT
jgi:hemolysin III